MGDWEMRDVMRKWGFKKWGPEQGEKRKNRIVKYNGNLRLLVLHISLCIA
jgi:hypothetical protein